QFWGVASLHIDVVVALFGAVIFGLAILGIPFVAGLGLEQSFLIALAMSFSSTVFAVKVLEERGEIVSLHSRIYIDIFIVQDLATVLFLAISTSRLPSSWAISILLLIPLRPVLLKILERVGHGELLVL
ncbi:MAG: cation:proton antiporter, partial [Pseudomonadota bacterium]|nr:cation:proton antiporter [Pseudomonadota bacterium]